MKKVLIYSSLAVLLLLILRSCFFSEVTTADAEKNFREHSDFFQMLGINTKKLRHLAGNDFGIYMNEEEQ